MVATFCQFFGHKMAKKKNVQNRYIKFVERHTENLQTKFQAVQMNVPFVTFHYRDLKVFLVVDLQANRDFQKIRTKARKNIFSCGFYILCISTRPFKIN